VKLLLLMAQAFVLTDLMALIGMEFTQKTMMRQDLHCIDHSMLMVARCTQKVGEIV
jgi:hypothetical protein